MRKILVIFGGQSVEHDISIITALQSMKNIKGYDFLPLYIKPNGEIVTADNLQEGRIYLDYERRVKNERRVLFGFGSGEIYILKGRKLKEIVKPYSALICCHGHGGEDGSLAGVLESCHIPYSSSSPLSSGITMDKSFTKIVLEKNHIPTPAYVYFNKCEYAKSKKQILSNISKKISLPCIVKPASGGSSVGIGICEDENMLDEVIENAFEFDDKVLVEKFIPNAKEFSCAVIKNGQDIICGKIWQVNKGKFFTFEEKYLSGDNKKIENIPTRLNLKIKKISARCYNHLECDGVVRVDFLYDEKEDKLFVGEVNSIPGSLAFNLFDYPFHDLISCLVEGGRDKMQRKGGVNYKFNSQAIEKYLELGDLKGKK